MVVLQVFKLYALCHQWCPWALGAWGLWGASPMTLSGTILAAASGVLPYGKCTVQSGTPRGRCSSRQPARRRLGQGSQHFEGSTRGARFFLRGLHLFEQRLFYSICRRWRGRSPLLLQVILKIILQRGWILLWDWGWGAWVCEWPEDNEQYTGNPANPKTAAALHLKWSRDWKVILILVRSASSR